MKKNNILISKIIIDFQQKIINIKVKTLNKNGLTQIRKLVLHDRDKNEKLFTALGNKVNGGKKFNSLIRNTIQSFIQSKKLI